MIGRHEVPIEQVHGPAVPTRDRPRLLLLSYHFTPSVAVGAQRWHAMSGLACEHGWAVDVVTLHPEELAKRDDRRLAELAPEVRVFGARTPSTLLGRVQLGVERLARALAARRAPARPAAGAPAAPAAPATLAALAAPSGSVSGAAGRDSLGRAEVLREPPLTRRGARRAAFVWIWYRLELAWARAAAAQARALAARDAVRYRAVVTCGPPHLVHTAGAELARALGLPHVVDMRDPWQFNQRLPFDIASPLWYRIASANERRAVERAALVVMNTEPATRLMRETYPEAAARIVTVMNGSDPEEIPRPAARPAFTIAHAGSVYIDRDPRLLFRAVGRLIQRLGLAPGQLAVEFIGNFTDFGGVPLERMAETEGIPAGFVHVGPLRPRREAMAFLARAHVLVSLPQDSDLAIPSKVFEYTQFSAWLLVLAKRGSAIELLLRDTAADVVEPDDVDGMERVLVRRYEEFARGEAPRPLDADGRFSRARQAARFFEHLDAVVGSTGARSGGRA